MKPVSVTSHALHQARVRRHFPGCREQQIKDQIRDQVREAIAAGRSSACTPVWAQLIGTSELRSGRKPRPLQLAKGQRFVWAADEHLGWIVACEEHEHVVITSLHRVRSRELVA